MTALPQPQAPLQHVTGAAALPHIAEALVTFEPSVLVTDDGRGTLYAPAGDQGPDGDELWFLVDAATCEAWGEGRVRRMSLTFQSRDDRCLATLSGVAHAATKPDHARALWRASFVRWFDGPEDSRLRVMQFTASHAEFYRATGGPVSRQVTL